MSTPHVDFLGNTWSDAKLHELLAEPNVIASVMSGANVGLRPNGTWSPAAVQEWTRIRYAREESAALLLLLISVWFDTDGRRYLAQGRGR